MIIDILLKTLVPINETSEKHMEYVIGEDTTIIPVNVWTTNAAYARRLTTCDRGSPMPYALNIWPCNFLLVSERTVQTVVIIRDKARTIH